MLSVHPISRSFVQEEAVAVWVPIVTLLRVDFQNRRDKVFPPTLVKEDEALPETADCRMDLTLVLRWGHDEPVVFCNPVLRSVN